MRLLRQFSLFALAVFAGLGLAACDGGGTTASLTSISVAPASTALTVAGPTTQLTVTGYYSDGRTTNLTPDSTFVSSNTGVLAVDASGVVTPVAVGTAVVTATNAGSGKTAATALITVSPTPPATLVSIAVTSSASAIQVGSTAQLTVTGTYSDNTTKDLTSGSTFVATTAGVVSVASDGVVTAVAPGTTTITATDTASGKTATTGTLTVTMEPPPTLQSIAVSAAATSLTVGGATTQLTVLGTYSDGSTQNLTSGSTFVANTSGVVSISAAGVVTPVAAGTTTITATNTTSGKTATTAVITVSSTTVPVTLQSIAVTAASSSLTLGGAATQLTVVGTYSDNSTQNLTSASTFVANTAGVVSISGAGVVTPVAVGTTTVTATHTASGKTATSAAITVTAAAPSYTILGFNDSTLTYNFDTFSTGATVALTSTGVPSSAPAGGPAYVQFIRHGASPGPADSCYSGATMWAQTATTGYAESIGTIPLSNTNSIVTGVVYVPVAAVTYRLKLEDASNPAHYVEIDVIPSTTGWQTLTWDAKKYATAAFDPTFTFNKLTLFPDFACAAGAPTPPANETLYVAQFTFIGASGPSAPALTFPPPPAAPSATAAAPTHPVGNVLSLYNSSGTYTDQAGTNYNPFGDSQTVSQYSIGSAKVWEYAVMNYQGWQFTTIDISSYTMMHVDVWTPDTTQFGVILVNGPTGQTQGQINFNATTTPAITKSGWIGLDIPISSFTAAGLGGTTSIYQLLFVDNVGGNNNGTFFIDNVYFWK